jgi:hypothetical protein
MRRLWMILLWVPLWAFAAEPAGIGRVASNLMDPVDFASDFIYTGCIIIGGSFLMASVIKYVEHRRSPLMVPISTVIFFLIAGLLLLLMPFLSTFTDIGVRYSIHFQ